MAALVRSSLRLSCNFRRLSHLYRIPFRPRIGLQTCSIFTSNKKKDSAAIPVAEKQVKEVEKADSVETDENWLSHGYYYDDPDSDEWTHHLHMFLYVTVPTAFFMLFIFYYPDQDSWAWEKREAFLELDRREKLGLPLIDANFVDPSKIQLPTDEELGDFDIIV